MKVVVHCLFLLSLALPVPAAVLSGQVKRLPAGERVEVMAYPFSEQRLQGKTPYHVLVDPEGRFELDLPVGGYFLLARGENMFGYYGRNPVAVPEQGLAGVVIPLVAAVSREPGRPAGASSGLAGRVTWQGRPVAGVAINVYSDMARGFRGLGSGMIGFTDEEGRFRLAVAPGRYYLLARKRNAGAPFGPLEAGDLFGFYPGNPVEVKDGRSTHVVIELVEVPEKAPAADAVIGGTTHISGRVLDEEGRPVAGVRVLLYMDPAMIRQPALVSRVTGADGRYDLSFPKGGRYFLVARDMLGGPPSAGQLYGPYQGAPGGMVQVETGAAIEGVDIVVHRLQ